MSTLNDRLDAMIARWGPIPIANAGETGGLFALTIIHGPARESETTDHVTAELLALARAGKEDDFRALASCVVAPGEVDELWAGTRRRVGGTT